MRKVLVGLAGLLLVAAASADSFRTWSFAKGDTAQDTFQRDGTECEKGSQTIYWDHRYENPGQVQGERCAKFDSAAFLDCMSAKGYQLAAHRHGGFKWTAAIDANRICRQI